VAANKILVCDRLAPEGLHILEQAGEVVVAEHTWSEEELVAGLGEFTAIVVRSQTRLTARAIAAAPKLKVVARAGVGVDNIDLKAATAPGVIGVNSPEGYTIPAAEHTVALLLAAARKIPAANQSLREGEWRRGAFMGEQVQGKTLGIVGVGKIGAEVTRRAQALGMTVLAFDPYLIPEYAERLGVARVALPELLAQSDFVSLHAPVTPETRKLIGAEQLALMKPTAILINCARGELVDDQALLHALQRSTIAGAALDVFDPEPPTDFELIRQPNVISTPHLGASTREAQINVATYVAEQVVDVLRGRPARAPVNLPALTAEALREMGPYLGLAERIGRLAAQLMDGPITSVELTYAGELAEKEIAPLRLYFMVGLMSRSSESVNLVNAPVLAQERGIQVLESKSYTPQDYLSLFGAAVHMADRPSLRVTGTVFGRQEARIVSMDGYRIDVIPEGLVLFCWHHDQPGIIGHVGTLLAGHAVNIAGMQVGRESLGGQAVMAVSVDHPILVQVQREIEQHPAIMRTRLVDFGPREPTSRHE